MDQKRAGRRAPKRGRGGWSPSGTGRLLANLAGAASLSLSAGPVSAEPPPPSPSVAPAAASSTPSPGPA